MSISGVGQVNYQSYAGVGPAAKPDPQDASSSSAVASVGKPSASAQAKDSVPDGDDAKKASSTGGNSSGQTMYKINPDGTVGPLHLSRPGHATRVVHA